MVMIPIDCDQSPLIINEENMMQMTRCAEL